MFGNNHLALGFSFTIHQCFWRLGYQGLTLQMQRRINFLWHLMKGSFWSLKRNIGTEQRGVDWGRITQWQFRGFNEMREWHFVIWTIEWIAKVILKDWVTCACYRINTPLLCFCLWVSHCVGTLEVGGLITCLFINENTTCKCWREINGSSSDSDYFSIEWWLELIW